MQWRKVTAGGGVSQVIFEGWHQFGAVRLEPYHHLDLNRDTQNSMKLNYLYYVLQSVRLELTEMATNLMIEGV